MSRKDLLLQIEDLKLRLEEADETLAAIRQGAVDAILVSSPSGDKVYTLQGAEHPYRVFFETMNEGAVTMSAAGSIISCNRRFAELVNMPITDIPGMSFIAFVAEDSQPDVLSLIADGGEKKSAIQCPLKAGGDKFIRVKISIDFLKTEDIEAVCAIVSDLSELMEVRQLRKANEKLAFLNEELRRAQEELEATAKSLHESRRAALSVSEDSIEARRQVEAKNAELLREITERKRAEEQIQRYLEELKASSEDLIRFNRAAVNRELRMVELKKEINDLCSQAGLPQRYRVDFGD